MRRRLWIVPVLVVGLALHNLVMSLLYGAGLRGHALSAAGAWKDVLLAAALALSLGGSLGCSRDRDSGSGIRDPNNTAEHDHAMPANESR